MTTVVHRNCRRKKKITENKQSIFSKVVQKLQSEQKSRPFSQWPSFANECIIDNTSTLTSTPNKGWHGTHPRACVYPSERVYGVGKYTQSRGFRCQSLSLARPPRQSCPIFQPQILLAALTLTTRLSSPIRGPIPISSAHFF